MKILHVLTSARAEGTPRLVLDWLTNRSLVQAVVFLNAQPTDLFHLFNNSGISVYMPSHNLPNDPLTRNWLIIRRISNICKTYKPDIVISWNQGYSNWIIAGAKLAGVKNTIVHVGCTSQHSKSFKNLLFSYFVHWPLWFMRAKLICASLFLQKQYKSIPFLPANNIFHAYNCVHYEKFMLPSDVQRTNSPIAIVVGNLEPIKNHASLLRAWKIVTKALPNAQLWIVGRGSLIDSLKDLSKQLKIEQQVVFWGQQDDVPKLLWQAKVFVFTSISEGFGTVFIEALAAGLYVVAYAQPAAEEVLHSHPLVTLVPVNNETLLAEKIIEKLLLSPPSIDNQQIEFLKQFSVEKMIKKYLAIFNVS